jgi:signal transduction histidine kinase
MPVLQLLGGTTIFLIHAIPGDFRPEEAFAAFLAFLVLVAASFAFPKARIRIPLILLKCAFCLALGLRTPYPLFLLPAILLEAPELFPARRPLLPIWAFLGLLGAAPLLLLPRSRFPELFPAFFISWAVCAFTAARGLGCRAREARLSAQARELERSLSAAESRRDALERERAAREVLARSEERESIAARLHDELGHAMTGSIMQLEAAALLFDDDPQRVRRIVGEVTRSLRQGLSSVRSSLRAIKPSASDLGIERIRAILQAFEAEQGIAASLSTEGAVEAMPQRIWLAVEANLREALTNTLRHSSGSSFRCRLCALNGAYKIEFRDDGRPSPSFRKGMGLEGMEARARDAGGTLIVDAGRGFSVIMLFMKGGD